MVNTDSGEHEPHKTPQERLYICMVPPITPHIRTIIGHHLRSLLWAPDLSCGTEEQVEMKINSPNSKRSLDSDEDRLEDKSLMTAEVS